MADPTPKGPLECEAEGCREPAQHFPVDRETLPYGFQNSAGEVRTATVERSVVHKFCDRHFRERERAAGR